MGAAMLHGGRLTFVLCAWLVTPAHADPVLVTGGSLVIDRPEGVLTLTGQRGFALDARVHTSFGVWGPELADCTLVGCGAGILSLFAHWSGTDVRGTASLDGDTQALRMDGPSAYLEFFASTVLPMPSTAPLTLSAPFTLSGLLFTGIHGEHRHELLGHGLTTVVLDPYLLQGSQRWLIRHARYDFTPNPIPEPSTLILLTGWGAAWTAHRLRARRRRPE